VPLQERPHLCSLEIEPKAVKRQTSRTDLGRTRCDDLPQGRGGTDRVESLP
jgi:hypothetical protein